MALKNFAFKVLDVDNHARHGLIETHRGNIQTPAFMPVGTQATVKACTIDDIKKRLETIKLEPNLIKEDDTTSNCGIIPIFKKFHAIPFKKAAL